jgi:large subunit ribosomal protein L5
MLNKQIEEKIKPELKKELGLKNALAVPQVEKVIINMRVPEGKDDRGALESPKKELARITGQKPKICRAGQSISAFSLTKGSPIGLKVTLRGKRMYDFLEKFFHLVLPRVKDFRGLSAEQFDDFGNYNLTLNDQSVFPEINVDELEKNRSLQITIVTDSDSVEESKKLLLSLGLPFTKEDENGK